MEKNGYAYAEIRKGMKRLPQAGIIGNDVLTKNLAPHEYYQCRHTPGLWRHTWRPVTLYLVEDDSGVKYIGNQHAEHLIEFIKKYYLVSVDWTGGYTVE